jgi:hypothetical protein
MIAEGSVVPFPNPLNGSKLMFRCSGKYENSLINDHFTISVRSILGETVFSGEFRASIDIGRISPGLYILTIANEQGEIISVSKLIKN